jgi:hypothetical protein
MLRRFLRLELLEGVAAFHLNDLPAARTKLHLALDKWHQLQVSTFSQHSVNIQSTFSQHSVNIQPTCSQHAVNTQSTLVAAHAKLHLTLDKWHQL